MRTITLNKMRIQNFKGIENLAISFDGKNTLIAGTNGIGKSTIADAYLWATTGKNMAGNARFEVRPRDKQGNEVHDVITSVECEFRIAEKLVEENSEFITKYTFTIKREELEDLTEKAKQELKPEAIAPKKSYYFIDNAPYDAKIFYGKLGAIMCDKDKFSILSNPMAFFMLKDSEQREILTAACGDVSDSEIDGYDKVREICGVTATPTERRDGLQKTIKATKKRLDEIPARVDSLVGLCDEYADYDGRIAELEKEQAEVKAQGEKLKGELKNCFGISGVMLPPEPSHMEIEKLSLHLDTAQMCLDIQKRKLQDAIEQQEKGKCPNCGYILTDNSFKIGLFENEVEEARQDLDNTKSELSKAQAEYDAAMQEYNAKVAEQAKVNDTSAQERKNLETCLEKLRERHTELSVEISKLQQAKQVQAQIKALRDEQKKLDSEFAADMTKLDIISMFLIRKAEAVVENINKRFERVKFKLFDMQTNGELKSCCKALIDGVSYANTNTASKVQVGIELIKLLSEFYGVIAPVWVDDKESVIDLPSIDAQTICLKVDEQYQELHIKAV